MKVQYVAGRKCKVGGDTYAADAVIPQAVIAKIPSRNFRAMLAGGYVIERPAVSGDKDEDEGEPLKVKKTVGGDEEGASSGKKKAISGRKRLST